MTADDAIAKAAIAYLPATYKRTLQHLEESPSSAEQIAEHLGTTIGSTYKIVMKLRELRVICVADYRYPHGSGNWIKVWGLGTRDVRQPRAMTSSERSKRWRQKTAALRNPPTIGVWGV